MTRRNEKKGTERERKKEQKEAKRKCVVTCGNKKRGHAWFEGGGLLLGLFPKVELVSE